MLKANKNIPGMYKGSLTQNPQPGRERYLKKHPRTPIEGAQGVEVGPIPFRSDIQ